jgi:hypothetical protein
MTQASVRDLWCGVSIVSLVCALASVASAQSPLDTTAPVFSSAVMPSRAPVGRFQCEVRWPAATDDVGVSSYLVFVRDQLHAALRTTSIVVDMPCVLADVTVYARDAAGNESAELVVPRASRPVIAPTMPSLPPPSPQLDALMSAASVGPDAISELAAQAAHPMPSRRAALFIAVMLSSPTTTRARNAIAALDLEIRACNAGRGPALADLEVDVAVGVETRVSVRGGSLAGTSTGACMVRALESLRWTPPPIQVALRYEVEHND